MATVAVIYHSDSGHTKLMAEAICAGAAAVDGIDAQLHELDRKKIVEGRYENEPQLEALDAADAVIFGCPTYMGDVSGPMKAFLDATLHRYYARAWSGKVAAGFTVSATPSGDKLNTLTGIVMCAMQLGMIWVGQERTPMNAEGLNRLGIYLGVGGQAEFGGESPTVHAPDLATGEGLGARVATVTLGLNRT